MKITHLKQETLKMRFQELYQDWQQGELTQEQAARILGISDRTLRRHIIAYQEEGLQGLEDDRITSCINRSAPLHEVMQLKAQYARHHRGWNVKHFHQWYQRSGGTRSYNWVRHKLQSGKLVEKGVGRGKHRKRRIRSPIPGMMLHQDGSTHAWISHVQWDLIITLDDATNEHYSMFFVEEEGTVSSFRGVRDVIQNHGLFSSFYTDRGSHYWNTPEAGGKVDKVNLTQFGRAMRQLEIQMIPAYSPEARGRCERMFRTHQDRLSKELAKEGIQEMHQANAYLQQVYMPAFNTVFKQLPQESGSAFVPWCLDALDDILCEQHERVVGKDNCVSFNNLRLQIPSDRYRMHYVKVVVRVHRYADGGLAVFHGPRRLANYDAKGQEVVVERG